MNIDYLPAKQADAADLPAIAALLAAVYPKPRNWIDDLKWHYLDNPSGRAWYVNAHSDDDGSLVGHYVVVPTPPLRAGKFTEHRIFLSLNTAVHPRAQGRGIFKRTASMLFEHLQALSPTIVLGAANANSLPGFIGSLGFYHLGRLDLRAYPTGFWPARQSERLLDANNAFLRWRVQRPHTNVASVPTKGALVRRMSFHRLPVDAILTIEHPQEVISALPVLEGPSAPWPLTPRLYATFGSESRSGLFVPDRLRPSPMHYICKLMPDVNAAPLINLLMASRFEFLDFDVA